ncbi:MAG TPA: CHAT domain-containing tetratricopeptide repeat protein [Polyangia bacterium]|nr:CHAT domain-containing tetratricopeptide repeat protein [Polyangia bacterium]
MMRIAGVWIAIAVVSCAVAGRAEEAPPDASLAQAQKDLDEAKRLYKEGQYGKAVPLAERALQIRGKAHGPNHPEVAECLHWLAESLRKSGNYAPVQSLLERALEIRESTLGKNHLDVAQSLSGLAFFYYSQGLFDKAKPLEQRALQIREAALGKNHPDVAKSLNNLAIYFYEQGAYERAEPLYLRALRIRETALGKNHPDVAQSLNNLGNFYKDQGFYAKAEPLYQRALRIREDVLGKSHPDVAQTLNNLGTLYRRQGDFRRAEPLLLRALQIREDALGKDHSDVAHTLDTLAMLYNAQGAYAQAEPLFKRSIRIWETTLGSNHPSIAAPLNNLAWLYSEQGNYDRAESLYQRVLRIQEATLGGNHPDVALVLNNLATIYHSEGLYAQAERLYHRAIEIQNAALGENNPDVATSLNNLAELYRTEGRYDQAEALHLHAIQIREEALGKSAPDVASSLNNLAQLYIAKGSYERAEVLHHRALQIRETALGKNHPETAESLRNFALLQVARGQLASALPLMQHSFANSERRLRGEAVTFSEVRLARFLSLLQAEDQTHYNLLHGHPSDLAVLRLALTTALLRKGRSAAEIADASRTIYRNLEPEARETFQGLRVLRTQFSSLSLAGPENLSPAAYQIRLQTLETQAEALEAELAAHSAFFRAQKQFPGPDDIISRVSAALPPDGALVELVAFSASPVVPPPNMPPSKVPSIPTYLALALLPSGDIRAVDLGAAEVIDGAVRRLRLALSSSQAENYLPAAQELYRLIFRPLQPLLGAQRRLFIAPDGQLHLVPFDALHDGTRFLAEAFDITYLTSGKDLVPKTEEASPGRSVVVLADPDFGGRSSTPAGQRGEASAPPATLSLLERSASLESFFAQDRSGLTGETWEPLLGTRLEAEAIHKVLPQARLLLGPAATKQALLEVAAPNILHIATHGFFLGDTAGPPGARSRQSVGVPETVPPAQLLSDPLLRSGLVLAGAQAASTSASDAGSDRVKATLATALELAGLNLWGTELVVLSACDTGRGEVKPGQGVYGLRRAFTVAGAETLVTSLWKVNDQTTHEFMKDFYEGLTAGRGRAEALREAMRRMRKRHEHPYYWAPFILVGNGAPLRGIGPARPHGRP